MKKEKLFCWHPAQDTVRNALQALFGVCLVTAFWHYRIYAAAFVIIFALLLLAAYQLRFVLVGEGRIRQFHWGRIDCEIPIRELERIDTRADGKNCMICLYGEQDILELPYRKKTLSALLSALGVSDEVRCRLLETQGADFCESSAGYSVQRETVQLDELFGKRAFVHRMVCDETGHAAQDCEAAAGSEM